MGQTLSNGVYLPNEGERNCYAGLASNWQILNTAVGNIAEKAPLVHTHGNITNDGKVGTTANRPLITGTGGAVQAGSFGNSANTFCEGNDSRLSDARTPLSHTHTKSDVTDLFNSANTWSESQTYSKTTISNAAEVLHCKNTNVALGETPASDYQRLFMFKDKNNDNFGYYRHLYQTTGSSQFDILVRNKFTNGAPDTSGSIDYMGFTLRLDADKSKEGVLMGSFKPSNTNTYDLGSSSYQWNKVYSKEYYYNGTAWGLDKENVWGKSQTISYAGSNVSFVLKHGETDIAASPTRNNWHYINFYDKNSISLGGFSYSKRTSGNSRVYLNLRTKNSNNDIVEKNVFFETNQEGTTWNLYPSSDTDIGLGTTTNKWKTLNGINPGALSLPNIRSSTQMDLTSWSSRSVNGLIGGFTAPVNCIVSIQMTRDVDWGVWVISGNFRQSFRSVNNQGNHLIFLIFPVAKGEFMNIYYPEIPSTENPITFVTDKQRYFSCLGNVS